MANVTLSEAEAGSLYETLAAVHSYLFVVDMQDSLRKLNRQNRSSPLTLSVEQARDLVATKIGVEVDGSDAPE